jgi:glycosyltransferase involved in cell wall biosynthesis
MMLVILFLVGRLGRAIVKDESRVVVTGDINYTGGTFVYFRSLVSLLTSTGFRVSILMPRRYYGKPLIALGAELNARVLVIPDSFAFVEHLLSLWKACQLRASRVIVSASGPGSYTMSLLWGIPSVHIMHSVPSAGVAQRSRRLISFFLRKPHRMVGVSKITSSSLCRYFAIPPSRQWLVSTVYNGVPDLHATTDVRQPSTLVLTVGHVASYKNPSTWLKTAEYVLSRTQREVQFIWAGDGPELFEYRLKTKDTVGIQFLGYTNDVGALLRRACVYYQPSRMESFGLGVAEAMSMAIPCVVSDRGGLPELVADGKSGFVLDSDDYLGQGIAILRLLEDRKLHATMSEESRKLYLAHFTSARWEKEIFALVRGKRSAGVVN